MKSINAQFKVFNKYLGWDNNNIKLVPSARFKINYKKNMGNKIYLPINFSSSDNILFNFQKIIKYLNEYCLSDFEICNHPASQDSIKHIKLASDMKIILNKASSNKKKMLELANSGYITATDLADYLVKNHSMSFRKAYQKTAAVVNLAEKNKKKLNELTLEELKKIEPKLTNDVLKVFDLKNSVNSKKSYGGTSFDNIKKMIMKYKNA